MDPVNTCLDAVWSLALSLGEVRPADICERVKNATGKLRLGPELGFRQSYDEEDVLEMKRHVRPEMVRLAQGKRQPSRVAVFKQSQLNPTQRGVSPKIVQSYIDNGHEKTALVVHYKGKYYVWDGHHRTVSDAALGKKTAARVVDF